MADKKLYLYSLSSRFISVIFLIFISVIWIISWEIQDINNEKINYILDDLNFKIQSTINNEIYNIEDQLSILALISTSSKSTKIDQNEVIESFNKSLINHQKNILDWLPIIWSESNSILKNENDQILEPTVKSNLEKFSLKFLSNKEFFSQENNIRILPAIMSVDDSNGNSLGTLVTGLYVKKLTEVIQELTNLINKDIYYTLIDISQNEFIFNSDNFNNDDKRIFLDNLNGFVQNTDQTIIKYNDKYKSYRISRIINSPFVIALGTKYSRISPEEYLYNILAYKEQILFIIGILCSVIYLFYKTILNPFLVLANVALEISKGEINTEIPKIYSKEGSAVAAALERIKESLKMEKSLIEEISQTQNLLSLTNLRLENQVLERTKALENALSEKTSFLNNLSHQIKTPLEAVKSIVENLFTYWKEFSEERKLELVQKILHNSQSLMLLLHNLLDLAKFSENKVVLNIENFDLVDLTKEIIQESKILYDHDKNLNINIVNAKAIFISADKNRIKQVLRNLIINAIRFSPIQGYIAIAITSTKITIKDGARYDAVHFTIHDQGVGIPEDELTNIFSSFTQGSNIKNKTTGTGLGLAICKDIINIHYGKIWAENNKDGGASFNFIIPIDQPTTISSYTPGGISLNKIEPNILIVDDEEVCLNSMEMLLYGSRYNVIKIKSAQFALKYLKEYGSMISIIFIDLMMPDMYGLNFISEIKNDPTLKDIPLILQTSSSDEEEIIKAVDIGIFSIIRKPYNKKTLLSEIEKALHFNKVRLELD